MYRVDLRIDINLTTFNLKNYKNIETKIMTGSYRNNQI
jgi:hypothetical protein